MESSTPYATRVYGPLKGEMEMLADPQRQAGDSSTGNRPIHFQAAPRDHLVWSIFNLVYFNFCCLGFIALIYSVKARDRKNAGDTTAASSYGSTAKILNIISLLLSLLAVILIIVLFVTGVIVVHNTNTAREIQWNVNSGK